MKSNFIYISLIFIIIISIFAITALPSHCAVFNYEDYITDIKYNSEQQVLFVDLPLDNTKWVFVYTNSAMNQTLTGANQTFSLMELSRIVLVPIGYNFIDISDVPVGATIQYGYKLISDSSWLTRVTSSTTTWVHNTSGDNNPSDNTSSYSTAEYTESGAYILNVTDSLTITDQNKTDFLRFGSELHLTTISTAGNVTASLEYIRLVIPRSMLQGIIASQDKTNSLITDIKDYLEQPSNEWIQKDIENKENISNKKDQITNLDNTIAGAGSINISGSDLSISGKVDYGLISGFMTPIWENSFILGMFTVTLAVCLCSYLLFGKKV